MHCNYGRTYEEPERYDRVCRSLLVKVGCKCPCGSISVVRLYRGATPGRIAVSVGKKFFVSCNNGNHDGIVDEAAQDGAVYLRQEHGLRGDLDCGLRVSWSMQLEMRATYDTRRA
jgi:hypothetical protein